MGERANRFFLDAVKLGGLPAKVRLASLSRITSAEAAAASDDSQLVARLTAAFSRLKREIDGTSSSGVYVPPPVPSGGADTAERLRRHISGVLDLMSQRGLLLSDVEATLRRVNEAATTALAVARASIWMLDDANSSIVCADLFDANKRTHESGMKLAEAGNVPYFDALRAERTILVHDAHNDPRTAGFSKPYLEPMGIGALLDVPIWVRGQMVGVLCHEHVGGRRTWDADEERCAFLLSTFAALALERGGRKSNPPSSPPH